jgi:hypothetical protein
MFTPGTTPVSGPSVQRRPASRIPLSSVCRPYRCSSPWWTYRVSAALIVKPLSPVAAGMDKYLLPRSNLLNNHLSMAGITQQTPSVVVRDLLYGHPFTVFGDGVFNRSKLHHGTAPSSDRTIPGDKHCSLWYAYHSTSLLITSVLWSPVRQVRQYRSPW